MQTANTQIPDVAELKAVLKQIQWVLVDANAERIIAAPARHLVQTQNSIAAAMGFFADRFETHYKEGVVVAHHRTVDSPEMQMRRWVEAQVAEEVRLHKSRLAALNGVAAAVARRRLA